jgi:predicted DNA-binding transcriptional regulator AlpA
MIDPMLDVKELAQKLDASVRTVWRWVAEGTVPKPVQMGRSTRWFESEIKALQDGLKESRDKKSRDKRKKP